MPRFTDQAGNVWEATGPDDPNPVFVSGPQRGPVTIGRPDPTLQYDEARAQIGVQSDRMGIANTQSTIQDRERDNARADAAAAREAEKADRERREWEAKFNPDGSPKPGAASGFTAVQRADAVQARLDADALERTVAELRQRYEAGPGSTSGFAGFQDYLPSEANKVFNDAGQQARGYVKRALGFTGGEGNTAAESSALYDPYLPSASDRDGQIEAKIAKLAGLARDARTRANMILGDAPVQDDRPNAMTRIRTDGGATGTLSAADAGDSTRSVPYPEQGQAEHDAMVRNMLARNGNRIDPQEYAQARAELDRKYGVRSDPQANAEWAAGINEYIDGGGTTLPTGIQPGQESMSALDQARNAAAANPLGAALIGAGDALSLGSYQMMNPGQMTALQNEGGATGAGMLAGQIGGAIGATMGGAGLAAKGAAKVAPQLLGGGKWAQFGRNLGTDVAYGAGYGTVTEGDPLTGAALAGVGSAGGQAIGSTLGRAIGGLDLSKAAEGLAARGVPLTAGRRLGEFASRVEDKMASLPVVGDMVRRRSLDSMEGFNRAAFDEAGQPIGYKPSAIGDVGIEEFQNRVSEAYDNATAGASAQFDDQFMADMGQVYQQAKRLPDDRFNALGEIVDARMGHLADAGSMTGRDYQQAMRALKANRSSVPGQFQGFEQEYRDGVTGAMRALEGTMRRGGGDNVIAGLDAANAANKGLKTLQNAVERARNGTRSGEVGIFAPSQLNDAVAMSERKYGANALKSLAQDGQRVLPSSVPNSGTADRLAQMAIPGLGAAAIGGGAGYAAGGIEGAQTGTQASLALGALLALGGTKAGQKTLAKVINDRPDTLRQIGIGTRKRKGLFGSAALPVVLPVN